jgi:sRNA-binding regulator protein Hfq
MNCGTNGNYQWSGAIENGYYVVGPLTFGANPCGESIAVTMEARAPVGLSLHVLPFDKTTPEPDFAGKQGGPFLPSPLTYSVRGDDLVQYDVSVQYEPKPFSPSDWLTACVVPYQQTTQRCSTSSIVANQVGAVLPDAVNVTVDNDKAKQLTPGLYFATITFQNTTTPSEPPSTRFIVLSVRSTAHDFNGDNKSDITWRNSSGTVAIWLMNGLQVTQSGGLGTVPGTWTIAGTGDFNGDGKTDILWRDSNGTVAIWLMNGLQVLQTGALATVPGNWAIAGTGDFNGDGKSDILWRDTSGTVAIWLLNGLQVSQSAGLGTVPGNWIITSVGDFNSDGKSDLLWRDTSAGTVATWFMNGLQVSSSASVAAVGTSWTIQGVNAD